MMAPRTLTRNILQNNCTIYYPVSLPFAHHCKLVPCSYCYSPVPIRPFTVMLKAIFSITNFYLTEPCAAESCPGDLSVPMHRCDAGQNVKMRERWTGSLRHWCWQRRGPGRATWGRVPGSSCQGHINGPCLASGAGQRVLQEYLVGWMVGECRAR
jgi:hypothetical protein